MAEVVRMPKLGLQMKSGLITEWYVKEGENVSKGTPVFAIETDKLAADVESTAEGTILKIVADAGEEIEVTGICCYVGEPREEILEINKKGGEKLEIKEQSLKESVESEQAVEEEEPERTRLFATPLARKLAKEYKVDLAKVKGSGPLGRIQKADVLLAYNEISHTKMNEYTEVSLDADVRKMSSMRKTIARRLTESKQNIPHVYFQNQIDATEILEAKEIFQAVAYRKNGNKLTINDIVLKAAAQALSEFEEINAQTNGEEITYFKNVHLGVAVSVPGGLIVPVICSAQKLGLAQLSREAFQLAKKARQGKLMPEEFTGGTFTVSNLGGYGLDSFQAIINPPESGILTVGSIKKKPVVSGDQICIREVLTITGSFDHRLVDGALAARFMARVSELLEHAKELFF